MKVAVNNNGPLRQCADKIGALVEKQEKNDEHFMWSLGALLMEGRTLCDKAKLAAAEGITGKTGDQRFGRWISNSPNLGELNHNRMSRAMNVHKHFAHRRELVEGERMSVLTELAEPRNDDVREQVVAALPELREKYGKPVPIPKMREYIQSLRAPAEEPTTPKQTPPEKESKPSNVTPMRPATPPAKQPAPPTWEDLLGMVELSSAALEEAKQEYTHPNYMLAMSLEEKRDAMVKRLAHLSKPERQWAMQAVVEVLEHEQELFEATARAQMPKYNRELEAKLKEELAEQKRITAELRKLVDRRFDRQDFKFIRGVLHSDRPVDEKRRNKAFDLFLKLEPLFK